MNNSRSSPNIAAAADHNEGTNINLKTSNSTNKVAYSQDKLQNLCTSMPTLNTVATSNNSNEKNKIINNLTVPPLHPPPLIAVIPSERVEIGIEHRKKEDTCNNPNLPKYTFTPSDTSSLSSTSCDISNSSSSSSFVAKRRWHRYQKGMGHGAGCFSDPNRDKYLRRASGPAADSGVDLSCRGWDEVKTWKSLGDISIMDSNSSNDENSKSSPPPFLPPKTNPSVRPRHNSRPSPSISRNSFPTKQTQFNQKFFQSSSCNVPLATRNEATPSFKSYNPNLAQSTPNLFSALSVPQSSCFSPDLTPPDATTITMGN